MIKGRGLLAPSPIALVGRPAGFFQPICTNRPALYHYHIQRSGCALRFASRGGLPLPLPTCFLGFVPHVKKPQAVAFCSAAAAPTGWYAWPHACHHPQQRGMCIKPTNLSSFRFGIISAVLPTSLAGVPAHFGRNSQFRQGPRRSSVQRWSCMATGRWQPLQHALRDTSSHCGALPAFLVPMETA